MSSVIASAIGVELVAATDGGGVGTDQPAAFADGSELAQLQRLVAR